MNKLISVVIPVYNVEKYVARCIESVLSQDYRNLEIILVDDGSTDCSGEICDEYALKDSRIRVIHQQNQGLGPARNKALDVMLGDLVLFIDSDDYILEGIISKLYKAHITDNSDIICCGYKSGNSTYYCNGQYEILNSITATKKMLTMQNMDANAWCKLYNSNLFEGIRYPACAYEVVPVTYKIYLKASQITNISECGYYIEKRQGSITRGSFGENNMLYLTLSKKMIEDICLISPDLLPEAREFYLMALLTMTEKSREDKAAKNTDFYSRMNKEFCNNFSDIINSKYLSKRKKVIAYLIKFNLYKIVKVIYDKIS